MSKLTDLLFARDKPEVVTALQTKPTASSSTNDNVARLTRNLQRHYLGNPIISEEILSMVSDMSEREFRSSVEAITSMVIFETNQRREAMVQPAPQHTTWSRAYRQFANAALSPQGVTPQTATETAMMNNLDEYHRQVSPPEPVTTYADPTQRPHRDVEAS